MLREGSRDSQLSEIKTILSEESIENLPILPIEYIENALHVYSDNVLLNQNKNRRMQDSNIIIKNINSINKLKGNPLSLPISEEGVPEEGNISQIAEGFLSYQRNHLDLENKTIEEKVAIWENQISLKRWLSEIILFSEKFLQDR